jgi:hypothetical protein
MVARSIINANVAKTDEMLVRFSDVRKEKTSPVLTD